MTDRVMVDIETLGTEPGCAILSIGAVWFDENGLGDAYYDEISLTSCSDAGLGIEAETLEWYLGRDDAAADVLSTGGEDIHEVLWDFGQFYADADELWANSPRFDCVILEHAYEATGASKPWGFRDERCFRTLAELPVAPDLDREGDKHNALDDAKHQARVASQALARLNGVVVDA